MFGFFKKRTPPPKAIVSFYKYETDENVDGDGNWYTLNVLITKDSKGVIDYEITGYNNEDGHHEGWPDGPLADEVGWVGRETKWIAEEFETEFRSIDEYNNDQPNGGLLSWACDYCQFIYYQSTEHNAPYLQIIGAGRSKELICEVGRGDEFPDYEVGTKEDAIESGLDVLHLYDVNVTYNGKSDEELGHEYGEYGSDLGWLSEFRGDQ